MVSRMLPHGQVPHMDDFVNIVKEPAAKCNLQQAIRAADALRCIEQKSKAYVLPTTSAVSSPSSSSCTSSQMSSAEDLAGSLAKLNVDKLHTAIDKVFGT